MASDELVLEINRGEDYTAQIIWNDTSGDGYPTRPPAKLAVVNDRGQQVLVFDSTSNPGTTATISVSQYGVLDLRCPASITKTLVPGEYIGTLLCCVAAPTVADPGAAMIKKVTDVRVEVIDAITMLEI